MREKNQPCLRRQELMFKRKANLLAQARKKKTGVYWLSNDSFHLYRAIPAVWRNKENDVPISIIGVHGVREGIHYLMIEGSNTGVPENEIFFI